MYQKAVLFIIILITAISCSKKKELEYEPKAKINPYVLYKEGLKPLKKENYFYANKKFSKQSLILKILNLQLNQL